VESALVAILEAEVPFEFYIHLTRPQRFLSIAYSYSHPK